MVLQKMPQGEVCSKERNKTMGIVIDFYTKKRVIGWSYTANYAAELYSIANSQFARKNYEVYLIDSLQKKHWVYRFNSEKEANTFMQRYNSENLPYILDEQML